MFNKIKSVTLLLILTILLSSCAGTTPNISGSNDKGKKGNSTTLDDISTGANDLENELTERNKVIDSIKDKQEFIEIETENIETNIETFLKSINEMRDLIVIDYKIILSVNKGLLDEKQINRDNYLYKYVKANPEEQSKYLSDMEDKIAYFSDEAAVMQDYISHIDPSSTAFQSEETRETYKLINYYIKNSRYKRDIITLLKNIITGLKNTSQDEYIYTFKGGIMGRGLTIEFNQNNTAYLLKLLSQ